VVVEAGDPAENDRAQLRLDQLARQQPAAYHRLNADGMMLTTGSAPTSAARPGSTTPAR